MTEEEALGTGGKDAAPARAGGPSDSENGVADAEFQGIAGESGVLESDESLRALIGSVYVDYSAEAGLSEAGKFVLQTLRSLGDAETSLRKLREAEATFGRGYRRDRSAEMIDLLLHFIRFCLTDHRVTKREIDAIAELRALLCIRSGSLYKTRKEDIRSILESQIDWIEADARIDYAEELYIVDLQRVLDLGYDQMLKLAQPHVTQILDGLYLQLSRQDTPAVRSRIDQLREVFCLVHYRQPNTK